MPGENMIVMAAEIALENAVEFFGDDLGEGDLVLLPPGFASEPGCK